MTVAELGCYVVANEAWDVYDLTAPHHEFVGTYLGYATEVVEQLIDEGVVADDPEINLIDSARFLVDGTHALEAAKEG